MEKISTSNSVNLGIRREIFTEESRKVSREAFFMTRRFDTIPQEENISQETIPDINELLEIGGSPTLEVALFNLDQMTSKQISAGNLTIKTLLEQGVIKLLVNLLANSAVDEGHKKVGLRILGNIASGPQVICKCVVEEGGIPLFLGYLNRSIEIEDGQLMEMSLWGLGNIAGDSKEYRIILLQAGLFEKLLILLKKYMNQPNESLGVLQHGVWLLSNICRDKFVDTSVTTYTAVPVLCELTVKLKGDSYLLTDISWALLQLSMIYIKENDDLKENEELIDYFIAGGLMTAINILLKVNEMPILLPSIRLINRIIKAKTKIKKECFDEEFLKNHKHLLNYKMRIVKQEFMRMLKELIRRDPEYILLLWKLTYLQDILHLCKNEDFMVKKEILNLVKYVILSHSQTKLLIHHLVEKMELIEILVNGLQERDSEMILDCLDCLFTLLNEYDIDLAKFVANKLETMNNSLAIIENLQIHKNQKICEKAIKILENFNDSDEEGK